MKKVDFGYVFKGVIIALVIAIAIGAAGVVALFIADSPEAFAILVTAAIFIFGFTCSTMPKRLHAKMEKKALELEKNFKHDYKFVAHNAVFYIDAGGRLGVVWRGNPSEIQLANLAGVTNIRTNDGKFMGGTQLVSCQFQLDGKVFKIQTLRVSGNPLTMKSPVVLEAISKADKLCELLNTAKTAAQNGR